MSLSSRFGISLLAVLAVLVINSSRVFAGNAFGGESITYVGDGGHEAWMIGQSQDVGYKYTSIAFLWLDLWSWDGTYCVYQKFEDKYVPISTAQAAKLLKVPEAKLQPPRSYRYPPGLFVFGPLVLLAAIASLRKQQPKAAHAATPADAATPGDVATPAEAPKPVKVDWPMDIGKPLATKHAVGFVCPQCGSTDYKSVKPATMVAFANDRVCKSCSTRYTPPTPLWARLIFGGFGLAAVGVGGALLVHMITTGKMGSGLGPIGPLAFVIVGAGCLYKAVTK
jgi:hypothetical protein